MTIAFALQKLPFCVFCGKSHVLWVMNGRKNAGDDGLDVP